MSEGESASTIPTPRNASISQGPRIPTPRNASISQGPRIPTPRNASISQGPRIPTPRNASISQGPRIPTPRNASISQGPRIRATWKKSAIGYSEDMKATIQSLGFRKLQHTRDLPDTPAVRGMLNKVVFLVAVEGQPWLQSKRARYKIPRARSAKKHSRGR